MKCIHALVLSVILAGLAIESSPGLAGLAPIALKEGCVLPLSPHNTIRLDSEYVTIRFTKTGYTVDSVFHLYNTEETTSQWVGVPKSGLEEALFSPFDLDFAQFDAWVDDQAAMFSQASDFRHPKLRRWMIMEVEFPGHAFTTIRIRYEARMIPFYYIYGTSRYWRDRIGKAAFSIDRTELGGIEDSSLIFPAAPGPRILTKNLLRYEIRDFEPEDNAQIRIHPSKVVPDKAATKSPAIQ